MDVTVVETAADGDVDVMVAVVAGQVAEAAVAAVDVSLSMESMSLTQLVLSVTRNGKLCSLMADAHMSYSNVNVSMVMAAAAVVITMEAEAVADPVVMVVDVTFRTLMYNSNQIHSTVEQVVVNRINVAHRTVVDSDAAHTISSNNVGAVANDSLGR